MMIYEWAVIGAGAAGIAAVGKLLDFGVEGKKINWIDPAFTVGDLGALWSNIPSNTNVKTFLQFLHASSAFNYKALAEQHSFAINQADPADTCYLRLIVEPLQVITHHLKKIVSHETGFADELLLKKCIWHIKLNETIIQARNVILAIGAEAKSLSYPSLSVVPLQAGMDSTQTQKHIQPDDTVAVFGSSHSAILVLRNLVELNIKKIINFYRAPLRYAIYLDEWILFDDTGLKGSAANWARKHLHGNLPENLIRVYSSNENIEHHLPKCNKIIYAVGFERRLKPIVEELGHLDYVKQCGIIAPGLFGIGIAFPEVKYNRVGILEHRVGLWKFMEYLHDVMPIWFKYSA